MSSYDDPFEALFALQRALDARRDSDWMGDSTAGMGSYPPINIFQRSDDFVAVVELPGINKSDLQIEAAARLLVSALDFVICASAITAPRANAPGERSRC